MLQHPATSCNSLQNPSYSINHAANMERATWHHGTTCSMQRTTDNVQPATQNLQHATCNLQRTTYNVQPATYNLQRTTCNLQRTTCNKRTATSASTSTGSLAFAALQGTSHGTDEPREACPAAATLTARCHRRALVGTPRVRPSTRGYPAASGEMRRCAQDRPEAPRWSCSFSFADNSSSSVRTSGRPRQPRPRASTARANRASPLRCRRSAAGAAMRRGA